MDNILSQFILFDERDVQINLAKYLQQKRKQQGYSRQKLAEQSTVPAATIKRFEHTGEISLRQFLRLWLVLDDLARLNQLTQKQNIPPKTIGEIIDGEF